MWEQILELAISNGLFAVLFLLLLVYVLRDSNAREKKYQDTIQKLSSAFSELTILKEKVVDISTDVEDIKMDMTQMVSALTSKQSKRKTEKASISQSEKIA